MTQLQKLNAMSTHMKSFTIALTLLFTSTLFAADIDTVYRKSVEKPVGGEITTVSKTEVVVTQKVGNKEESIPANDIRVVEFKGEPPVSESGTQ